MRIRKAGKKDIRKIAKVMIDEFSKPPFKEKTTINSVTFITHKKASAVKFYAKQGYKIDKNALFMNKNLK